MRLIFRLGIAGVAAYAFMPILRDIAAVDFMAASWRASVRPWPHTPMSNLETI